MERWKKVLLVACLCLTGCTKEQMRQLNQSMSCNTAEMRTDMDAPKTACGYPYQLTSFDVDYTVGSALKMKDGAPAPLFRISFGGFPGGGVPTLVDKRIQTQNKEYAGETGRGMRSLACRPVSPDKGYTSAYDCEFEDGYIRSGEFVLHSFKLRNGDCDPAWEYKLDWDAGAELCADYKAPEGYPIVRLSSPVRVGPFDQRKFELGQRVSSTEAP